MTTAPNARPVLFLASTATHVETFGPVVRALGNRQVGSTILTLDRWYGYGAWQAGRFGNLPMLETSVPPSPPGPFYRRGTMAIWRDVLSARRPLADDIGRSAAGTLVVGNDSGLLEKFALDLARRNGWTRFLIQDGRLVERPMPRGAKNRVRAVARRLASGLMRRLGYPYLGASAYGSGDLTGICASGPAGARLLANRARPGVVVHTIGQPRYDALQREHPAASAAGGPIALFTSPFAVDGYGSAAQEAQLKLAVDLARALHGAGSQLVVKPHPRASAPTYAAAVAAGAEVAMSDAATVLRRCSVAIIGLSTLIEEAAIVHRPVIVPGDFIHHGPLVELLPDTATYPRFETASEALALIEQIVVDSDGHLLAEQESAVQQQVTHDPARPAAARVAEVVLGL